MRCASSRSLRTDGWKVDGRARITARIKAGRRDFPLVGIDEVLRSSVEFVGKRYVDPPGIERAWVRARRVVDPWSAADGTLSGGKRSRRRCR